MLHWHGYRPEQITDEEALKRHQRGQVFCSDCPIPAKCKPSKALLEAREQARITNVQAATFDKDEPKKG